MSGQGRVGTPTLWLATIQWLATGSRHRPRLGRQSGDAPRAAIGLLSATALPLPSAPLFPRIALKSRRGQSIVRLYHRPKTNHSLRHPIMKLEHIALNVSDPVAVASWYCRHFQLRIVRHLPLPAQTHFLADSDATVLEIYCNPPDRVPDYRSLDPLILHLAFVSADPASDSERLVAAGASIVNETHLPDGSFLIMMRDPWGLAFQLCKRTSPLI